MPDNTLSRGCSERESEIKAGVSRPVEIGLSLACLIVLSPLIALSVMAIALTSRGPVLFRQKRVGRQGRLFTLYKLRTMRVLNNGPQVTAADDCRMTRVGKLLRKTKLDELPELWNVVKGDMSLVGPRPEVPRYVDLQNPAWQMVLRVRPGLTDPVTLQLRNEEALLAQIDGDRERFYLDVLQPYKLRGYLDYLGRRSWREDVKVLSRTLIAVVIPSKAPPPKASDLSAERLA